MYSAKNTAAGLNCSTIWASSKQLFVSRRCLASGYVDHDFKLGWAVNVGVKHQAGVALVSEPVRRGWSCTVNSGHEAPRSRTLAHGVPGKRSLKGGEELVKRINQNENFICIFGFSARLFWSPEPRKKVAFPPFCCCRETLPQETRGRKGGQIPISKPGLRRLTHPAHRGSGAPCPPNPPAQSPGVTTAGG